LEEVAMHAAHKVLMEVDDNNALIVGDPQGILDQKLGHCLICLLNIIFTEITLLYY
jgi:hypothetical protein